MMQNNGDNIVVDIDDIVDIDRYMVQDHRTHSILKNDGDDIDVSIGFGHVCVFCDGSFVFWVD